MENKNLSDYIRCKYCMTVYDVKMDYCPSCGVRNAEKATYKRPEPPRIVAVYGPPITGFYRCERCKKEWTKTRLGSAPEEKCPECGSTVTPEQRRY
ncbi:MAG: hypothetical protein IJY04_09715 [Clostridia bacterium]|nr:hypothetical protein [Clostridia bacterium]